MASSDWLDRALELPGARRYERYVAALCPFHNDRSPSLLVYPDGFHCTACGVTGSLEYLFQRAALRPAAPEKPRPQYRPDIPLNISNATLARSAHQMLMQSPGLQTYLCKRGLERAMRPCQLGYWDGWYTVPVTDREGSIVEMVFRSGPWVQSKSGTRFYQRSGQAPTMYVPDWSLLQDQLVLFVTFGLFDAITVSLMGLAAATSTLGKGSFKAEWLGWWDGYVVIVPDLLEEKEARVLSARLGWRGHVLTLPYPEGCKDPNDWAQVDANELNRRLHGYSRNLTDRVGSVLADARGWQTPA